jgi:hypothetical protein
MIFSLSLIAILIKAGYQEAADFLKLENLKPENPYSVLEATERVRRVTWRIGLLGAALLMFLLYSMGVTSSSPFSVGIAAWICITSCLNFRAYHVEDMGSSLLKKTLAKASTEKAFNSQESEKDNSEKYNSEKYNSEKYNSEKYNSEKNNSEKNTSL